MKLHLLNRSSLNDSSFSVSENRYPHFLKVWHFHPEIELVFVLKSRGTCFIGDSIERFTRGDVVLIGKNLPHMWVNDDEYYEPDSILEAHSIVGHFKYDFAGVEFLNMPEMTEVRKLLEKADHGIRFFNVSKDIKSEMTALLELNGFEKLMNFVHVLNKLSKHNNYKLLSSTGFLNSFNKSGQKKLKSVYEYIINNFKEDITLSDVAEVAHMNPSAFSRFFKRVNRKTYSKHLSEVRVGYACKLLLEGQYNITEVCFESGFNNISNFNRQFKNIMKYTPTEYLMEHKVL